MKIACRSGFSSAELHSYYLISVRQSWVELPPPTQSENKTPSQSKTSGCLQLPPGSKGTQSAFYIGVARFHFITVWEGKHANGVPTVYFIYNEKKEYMLDVWVRVCVKLLLGGAIYFDKNVPHRCYNFILDWAKSLEMKQGIHMYACTTLPQIEVMIIIQQMKCSFYYPC